jgi:tetratricopeptide (TPR) repeat protein
MALLIGGICYEIDAYEDAIQFFMQSEGIYGAYSGTYFNIAVCHYMLGNNAEALRFLEIVRQHDPNNGSAEEIYRALCGSGQSLEMEEA